MQQLKTFVIAVLVIAVILGYFSMFRVDETQKAVKFQMGQMVGAAFEPGLHFKIPIIQTVRRFDARIQTLDQTPDQFLTQEQKNVIVDSFLKWRVADARTYYTTVGGRPDSANRRLSAIVREGLRNEFAQRTIQEVISGDRAQIMQVLQRQTAKAAESFGLDVVDLRIRRIDLPEAVSDAVFDRMRADRERVARDFRARGAEAAERIRAEADRQREVILAEAFRDAEQMRGEGDAKAAHIYAAALGQDPEFFSFYRSLNAYKRSFSEQGDVLILSPDSEFFRYFERQQPGR